MTALDDLRTLILEGVEEETPDGRGVVVYDGRNGGVRLFVNREKRRAIASKGGLRHEATHSDIAIAAQRALSAILTGGISR